VTKAFNAEQAGAVAIIITDQDEENDMGSVDMIQDGTERDVSIPALYLLGKDGLVVQYREKYEDTKGVIRSCKSKDRQCNVQKKKDKRTNNDLQYTTQKTKDRATQIPLKIQVL
jgi:hypothetical protein